MSDARQKAAVLIAGIMMAHFDGPFDDSSFYDELIDGEGTESEAEGAKYFDENLKALTKDLAFGDLVADEVRRQIRCRLTS